MSKRDILFNMIGLLIVAGAIFGFASSFKIEGTKIEVVDAKADADNILDIFHMLPDGACFVEEEWGAANHSWEVAYAMDGPIWVMLKKDPTGFLVAQPNPECGKDPCDYWLRTVEYKDNWVRGAHNSFKAVPCPDRLNRVFFENLIKEKYNGKLQLQ